MTTLRRKCFAVLFAALGFLFCGAFSETARAAPAFTWEKGQISGGLRFGSDNLDFGVGVRGGYTLGMGLYIGGVFDYWFGDDDDAGAPFLNVESNVSYWDLMAEVGYDFGITPSIMIRPFGGFGIFHWDLEVCGPVVCDDSSDSEAAGEFGGILLFAFGSLHLGPELRVLFADDTAVVFGADIGGHF